ncbi:MAG: hypothetical protein PHV85_00470 [Desulfovibrionaceae bacterium]|nr:hypothetical protein [Desulfovibrionaceae bacterium]
MSEAPQAPETGQGEGTTSGWLEQIPETMTFEHKGDDGQLQARPLREHDKLRQFKDMGELAKSYVNLEKKIGQKTIGLTTLPEDASDEDKANFDKELRRVMQVPEAPEGYEIKVPEDMAEHKDEAMLAWFQGLAHKIGLSPAQAQSMSDAWGERSKQYWAAELEKMAQAKEQSVQALDKHFGDSAKAKEAVEVASRGFIAVAAKSGVPEAEAMAFSQAYGDEPVFIKVFDMIGKQYLEDALHDGPGGPRGDDKKQSREDFYDKEVFSGKGV